MSAVRPIEYSIFPQHRGAHLFELSCRIPDPDPQGQRVSMPAWIPGSYLIRDFARHVVRIRAECDGQPVACSKTDKSSWRCAPCAGPLRVIYQVYAYDLSVRGAYLDTMRGYFNGPCVFLQVQGRERSPVRVHLQRPPGDDCREWEIATSMAPEETDTSGFGLYSAADYAELIDHPVEMGKFLRVRFEACGVPHEMAISGRHRADPERLARDLQRLCEQHIRFFGEPAPMERYLFLVTALGEGYGGLEHRSSSSLMCRREELPLAGRPEMSDSYRRFLGLCSHEYFHLWNIKRIKPAVFADPDLGSEVYTRLLWVFEGITSYYDDLTLLRCGLIDPQSYLRLVGDMASRVYDSPGRHKQSLSDSSFDAWVKFYKRDENSPNAIVSYYAKGMLVALALDLSIRRRSDGAHSLDDVMRALWERFGKTGEGLPEDGFEALTEEVTGLDLSAFFDEMVRGTEDPPLAELLQDVGVRFELQSGPANKAATPQSTAPALGVMLARHTERAMLAHVLDEGAAQEAGLAAGDELVAVDGVRVSSQNLHTLLAAYSAGDQVPVQAFRRDELMTFEVGLRAPAATRCVLSLEENPQPRQLLNRTAWLRGRL